MTSWTFHISHQYHSLLRDSLHFKNQIIIFPDQPAMSDNSETNSPTTGYHYFIVIPADKNTGNLWQRITGFTEQIIFKWWRKCGDTSRDTVTNLHTDESFKAKSVDTKSWTFCCTFSSREDGILPVSILLLQNVSHLHHLTSYQTWTVNLLAIFLNRNTP